jgi:hypothetical protein
MMIANLQKIIGGKKMALVDDGNMVMPVSPMYGNGNGNSGFGGDWGWIVLLLLLGWGNNGNGFGGGNGGGNIYPWMNQANLTSEGFQNAMMNDNITEIRSGVSNLSTQLCNCCGDMQMAVANGFAGVEQGANARQMANMQTAFASQTAMQQGFNQLASQQAECCCENRLASCQTQNIIQNEGNATRFADANNTRDIIDATNRGNQMILDKLCQLELDGFKRENDNLRTQLNMATLRESQTAQNAFISQGFANEVDQLYNRLNNCPVPTTPVYGRTPIFTCNGQQGCGCGGNTFYN